MKPPVAQSRPHRATYHGVTLEDPYNWLKDPGYPEVTDPDVLAYLQAENDYFEAQMAPHQSLVQTLFDEIKGRQPAEDSSVPHRQDDYWYRWRYHKDAQYRAWERAPVGPDADQPTEALQTILDEAELAEPHHYFRLGGFAVSPNGRYLAYSADTNGSERFTLSIKDLYTHELVDEPIPMSLGAPVWDAHSTCVFYRLVNDNWRPCQVRLHQLGQPLEADRIIYEEADDSFFVGLGKTQSEAWVVITASDHVTAEARVLPAALPDAAPRLVRARETGHDYDIDHREGWFYIRTNQDHKNFSLVRVAEDDPAAAWETLLEGSDAQYITDHLCLKDHVIVTERIDGLDQIRVLDAAGDHFVQFPEPAYRVGLGTNSEYATDVLRLVYTSLVTPGTVYDYHLLTHHLQVRKVQKIPTGYEPELYTTERLHALARDGVQVPVSIVYRRDRPRKGPLYLYGYGAYGMASPPEFSASRLSLLDRGFAFAIAHIRGGDDLGYHWYEQGKLSHRTNTFNDFVDVARYLVAEGWTEAGRIAIAGGSAGGELMGAVVNQAPELWGAVAAHVPFVDVLNTMLDASLPLTPIEWPEWGNPLEDAAAFELIHSYSPYDQLKPGAYPPMLVTAGLNDPRVTYWEPAKYVARLRTLKTTDTLLLLKTNMSAGHGGLSGRYDALMETAEEYAFFLVSLGIET